MQFLSEWDIGTGNSYREQLLNCAKKSIFFITVDLDDLYSFDPSLCQKLRESPSDYLPAFEQAADEYYLSVQPAESGAENPHFQIALRSMENPKMLRDLDSCLMGKLIVTPGIIIASAKPVIKAKVITA